MQNVSNLDISDRALVKLYVSTVRRTDFRIIHISNGDALIAGPVELKTVEDLKGKRLHILPRISEDILVNSLTKAGMTINDVPAMDMDAYGMVTAMISGGVTHAATWSPNSLKIFRGDAGGHKVTDNVTYPDQTVSLAS
ncbi:MAG: ABC transporter substrate-binding protein [Lachnospiraceae bacterium]